MYFNGPLLLNSLIDKIKYSSYTNTNKNSTEQRLFESCVFY